MSWKLFKPNKPTRQLSFWEFRIWGGLQLLIIHFKIHFKIIHFISRAVGSSPKCIRKKPTRRIQENLKSIIWYSSYESSKTGKCYAFLVCFIIPLLWPWWFMSPFVTRSKIFSKISLLGIIAFPIILNLLLVSFLLSIVLRNISWRS